MILMQPTRGCGALLISFVFLTLTLQSLFQIPLSVGAKDESLYKILGVSKTATTKEIKSAYRRKALDTHPDKRKDMPAEEAAEAFHKVVHAFEVLSDDSSRKNYDRTGRSPQQGQAAGSNNNNGNAQWSGGFKFHWNHGGGGGRYQRRRLKDMFKVRSIYGVFGLFHYIHWIDRWTN